MKPTPLTKKQFVWWFFVFTIGIGLWLSVGFSGLGGLFLFVSNLLLMSKDERSRPVPGREMVLMFICLMVFVVLAVAAKFWLPKDSGSSVERVMHHPMFAIGFWGFIVWLVYRRRYKVTRNAEALVG